MGQTKIFSLKFANDVALVAEAAQGFKIQNQKCSATIT